MNFNTFPQWKKRCTQCFEYLTVTQVGMRSHLLRTKIKCFQDFSFFRYVSMLFERVPMGSRASSTWMMTSDESTTYRNNNQSCRMHPDHTSTARLIIMHNGEGGWKLHLVKLSPDPLGLTLFEDFLACFVPVTK